MFFTKRYFVSKKALTLFKTSSSPSISLILNKKEYNRLVRKKQFRDLVFASNPYEIGENKTYTIFKNW